MARPPLRVLFCCTGVGILNRGIESFFREAFDNLHATPGLEARLVKGGGPSTELERVVRCIPRTSALAAVIGKAARRNAYVAEQWSSFLPVVRQIRQFRPEVVFYSDANLGFLLYWLRRWIGVPYRLLFSNGGPCRPPFVRLDFVHQVNPVCLEEALRAGEPAGKAHHGPLRPRVGAPPGDLDDAVRRALRERLGLPADRPVVLSVGWISRAHKRMDYVVEEVARTARAAPVPDAARRHGPEFRRDHAPRPRTPRPGRCCRALGALRRGRAVLRGRRLLRARLAQRRLRPRIPRGARPRPARDRAPHPVMRYVLGEHGILADLSVEGALAATCARSWRDRPTREPCASVGNRCGAASTGTPWRRDIGGCSSMRRRLRWQVSRLHVRQPPVRGQ